MIPLRTTLALGLLLRLAVAAAFHGSDDIDSQLAEGTRLLAGSPVYTVTTGNKLPLGYLLPSASILLASASGLPVSFTMKLPAIAGDVLAAVLLRRFPATHAAGGSGDARAALYFLNPATIMLSAYHGNVDPLMAALVLAAVLLASREVPVLGGVALGVAIAMKPPAILALPVLAVYAGPVARWRFAAAALAVPALVSLPFALADPGFARVFEYSSRYGTWGIPLVLKQSEHLASQIGALPAGLMETLALANHIARVAGRYVLLIVVTGWLVFVARHRAGDEASHVVGDLAATFFVFYVFAPGFGVQYFAWALPVLVLRSRRLATVHVAAITPFLLMRYVHAVRTAAHGGASLTERLSALPAIDVLILVASGVLGLAAWAVSVWILYRLIRGRMASEVS